MQPIVVVAGRDVETVVPLWGSSRFSLVLACSRHLFSIWLGTPFHFILHHLRFGFLWIKLLGCWVLLWGYFLFLLSYVNRVL